MRVVLRLIQYAAAAAAADSSLLLWFCRVCSQVIEDELGLPWGAVFSYLSPNPVAAASLGQVYRGRLAGSGAEVAVKVRGGRYNVWGGLVGSTVGSTVGCTVGCTVGSSQVYRGTLQAAGQSLQSRCGGGGGAGRMGSTICGQYGGWYSGQYGG